MNTEDIIHFVTSPYNAKDLSTSEVLEMEEDPLMNMGFEGAQKGKAAMNTILEFGKALLQAAREGDTASVMDLMSKGAPFTSDWLGTSPLHLAVMNNHLDTCETLLRAGIGKDAKTKVDRSPLHFAAYEGHADIVRLLLKHNVEIDCRDMLHMTPLHWAVERQHEECAILLMKAGADPMAISRFHKTPISIAQEMKWDTMVDMLQYAHLQKSRDSISSTAQAVEGISDSNAMTTEDITTESEPMMENDEQILEDQDTESQEHIENIIPKVSQVNNEATVQLLKEHGIIMLPNDNTNTVTSAIQSGRKIVLSDAGKLLLKDINETPKNSDAKKKSFILPLSKTKNAKIFTVRNGQFYEITGQNKSLNAVTKIPVNISKLDNIVQNNNNKFKTLPLLKAINIHKPATKLISNDVKLVSPIKGKIIALNSLCKSPGSSLSSDLLNVKGLVNQGKTKIIQLKNASNLGKTVKIVVKNSLNNKLDQNVVSAIIDEKNAEFNDQKMTQLDDNTAESQMAVSVAAAASNEEVESLKKELTETKNELEIYKKKIQTLENELNSFKSQLIVVKSGNHEAACQQVDHVLHSHMVDTSFVLEAPVVGSEMNISDVGSELDTDL